MCRLLAYSGQPIFLEDLVCKPEHSLVHQSMQADEAKVTTNGDGFGLGWYGERVEPGIYREVTPAWSDDNLLALCSAVKSHLFFAHVRATTGTAVARQNCHPFAYKNFMYMHNGQIGGYASVRREIESLLSDGLYALRRGATDSEAMFLLIMQHMQNGQDAQQATQTMLDQVRTLMRNKGISAPLRYAAVLADGNTLHAVRYSTDDKPPTMYLCSSSEGTVIASEPLQDRNCPNCPAWASLEPGVAVTIEKGQVTKRVLQLDRTLDQPNLGTQPLGTQLITQPDTAQAHLAAA